MNLRHHLGRLLVIALTTFFLTLPTVCPAAILIVTGSPATNAIAGGAEATIPTGWRRTKHGWEDTTSWSKVYINPNINQLIDIQREREPAWIRGSFAKISSISPVMVALFQIVAIAVIVNCAQSVTTEKATEE